MVGGGPAVKMFTCPKCRALYQVVKVERGPEINDRDVTCRSCGVPLSDREGNFVLKYFMLRKAGRAKSWRRRNKNLRSTLLPAKAESPISIKNKNPSR
jgi:hypothetical protein